MHKKQIALCLTTLAVFLLALGLRQPALAQTCGQYGTSACPAQDLSIDKKVKNPITGEFQENLVDDPNQPNAKYSPGSEVTFSLKVTNSGNQNFPTVQVTDTLPERFEKPKVDDVLDPGMVTDVTVNDRTITFLIKDGLKPGESKTIKFKAKVVSSFPTDKTVFCGSGDKLENHAEAKAEDRSNSDNSSICVSVGKPGEVLPQAGLTDFLPILPFAGIGLAGIKIMFKRKD